LKSPGSLALAAPIPGALYRHGCASRACAAAERLSELLRRGNEYSFPLQGFGPNISLQKRESPMAVLDTSHRSTRETNVCAVKFCGMWIGFFVAIGVLTY